MTQIQLGLLLKEHLTRLGKTICAAESLTAGNLCATIASASGSSSYFEGGVVAYNLVQKVNLLGVDEQHARANNCVSARVAQEMALGVRNRFNANIALATTGYAERSPENMVESPFAFFAIDIDGEVTTGQICGEGLGRVDMQEFVVKEVLDAAIERLVQLQSENSES